MILTKRQIKQMIKEYRQDIKVKYIVAKLGISRPTMYKYLKENGVEPNRITGGK